MYSNTQCTLGHDSSILIVKALYSNTQCIRLRLKLRLRLKVRVTLRVTLRLRS